MYKGYNPDLELISRIRESGVNIVNPFRGTWVVGTPGSGKTFSINEPFIRQHSEKGFAVVLYDYKFPTLATKLYYHYLKNKNAKDSKMPKGMKFNMINFVDVEYSRRVNPIQLNISTIWQQRVKRQKPC